MIGFFLEDLTSVIYFPKSPSIEGFWTRILIDIFTSTREEIELINLLTVGRVEVSDIEDLPIFLYLLESFGRMEIVFFRFDDREIDSVVSEEVVGIFLFSFATDELATIGKRVFTHDQALYPAIPLELRINVFGTGIGFRMHTTMS